LTLPLGHGLLSGHKGVVNMKKRKIFKKVLLAISSVVLGLVVLVSSVVGVTVNKGYQDAFQEDYYLKFEDPREQLIALALLAPSSHNIQPWLIKLSEEEKNEMTLYINTDRILSAVDGDFTQMVFSSGVFLEYMNEGAKIIGVDLEISYFPEGELSMNPTLEEVEQTPIALISYQAEDLSPSMKIDACTGATERLSYDEGVDSSLIEEMITFNKDESSTLSFVTEDENLTKLRNLLIEGVEVESKNEAAMLETANIYRFTNYQKNKYGYGLSMESDHPNQFMLTLMEFLGITLKQSWEQDGVMWLARDTKTINSSKTFGLIQTRFNTRLDQIKSGIMYGKIQLFAYSNGLEMQPLYQTLEKYDEISYLNDLVHEEFAQENNTIQMIFRMGVNSEDVSQGMRLHVEDITKK